MGHALCIALFIFSPSALVAQELDLVNNPVNASGLTGLLHTAMPYTLQTGTVEIGISIFSESSVMPDRTISEYPVSVTVGLSPNSEIAFKSSYYTISEGPSATAVISRKTGEFGLSYKLTVIPKREDSMRPAVALIAACAAPTDETDGANVDSASHWGVRAGIAVGSEFSWKEHILGVYADGQLAGRDLTEDRLRDLYGIFNAGLIFPISKYQNLQMFLEYSLTTRSDRIGQNGGDFSSITYGLRLVNERFNLTVGTQFIHKYEDNFDNTSKMIGLISMKF